MFALQSLDHVLFNLSYLTTAAPITFIRKSKKSKEKRDLQLYQHIWSVIGKPSRTQPKPMRIPPILERSNSRIFTNFINSNGFPPKNLKYVPAAALPFQCENFQIRSFHFGNQDGGSNKKNDLLPLIRKFLGLNSNEPGADGKGSQDKTKNEPDQIKIAFAEGFAAGQRPKSRMFQPIISLIAIVGLLFALLIITTGSVFKMSFGRTLEVNLEEVHITFDDVKGVDEAKQELKDVVEFLKYPEKFTALGGKLTKGVLLVGPPGTGKTLLARAVAGEAGVPFFHAAGPEFDEVLVGQGARRVRELFKIAKENSPCVIFIDEIDSIGSKRTTSDLHPYANQTINQLLAEMDGFHQNQGVIVLGATNRREDLDKALLRPGRFDVEVAVPPPDFTGRKDIINLYLEKILHEDINVEQLARGTTGFTGADIENMVNQAALKAAIEGAGCVTMQYLEGARDKVLMGPERRSRIPDAEANKITAYHEGGHTVVGYFTEDAFPLHKVTIVPRGHSLGHTAYLPEKEHYHITKSQMMARLDTLMGGRAAEELIFGPEKITSGAASDLQQATTIATKMVKDWGMSEKIGVRTLDDQSKSYIVLNDFGQQTNDLVDSEIKRILQESYERAKHILKSHAKEHKLLAEALLQYETLDAEDIQIILSQKKIPRKTIETSTKKSI